MIVVVKSFAQRFDGGEAAAFVYDVAYLDLFAVDLLLIEIAGHKFAVLKRGNGILRVADNARHGVLAVYGAIRRGDGAVDDYGGIIRAVGVDADALFLRFGAALDLCHDGDLRAEGFMRGRGGVHIAAKFGEVGVRHIDGAHFFVAGDEGECEADDQRRDDGDADCFFHKIPHIDVHLGAPSRSKISAASMAMSSPRENVFLSMLSAVSLTL